MLRILIDLAWWCGTRAWHFARAWTGDDAYERYLAELARSGGDTSAMTRSVFFARHVEEKWRRNCACGRFDDRP